MSFRVEVEWPVFQQKFLRNSIICVREDDTGWTFYANEADFIVKTFYPKHADWTDDVNFIQTYFHTAENIIQITKSEDQEEEEYNFEDDSDFDNLEDETEDTEVEDNGQV